MRASAVPGAGCPVGTGWKPLPLGKPRRKDVVSRCRSWIAIVAILIIATALAAFASPEKASAASLKSQLRKAKLALDLSRDRLQSAEAALAAATETALATTITDPAASPAPSPSPTATPEPALTVEQLKAKVAKARKAVRVWKQRVRRLARQYRMQRNMIRWERRHQWRKIIEVAAAKYHVKADGMYRMMMRESGGQQYAGSSGAFKGLFQYWTGTWAASWNPWRHDSIYDGSSQSSRLLTRSTRAWVRRCGPPRSPRSTESVTQRRLAGAARGPTPRRPRGGDDGRRELLTSSRRPSPSLARADSISGLLSLARSRGRQPMRFARRLPRPVAESEDAGPCASHDISCTMRLAWCGPRHGGPVTGEG